VKIFQKVFGGYFFGTPCRSTLMIKAASTEKKLNINLPLQHDDQTTLESGQDIIWQKLSVE